MLRVVGIQPSTLARGGAYLPTARYRSHHMLYSNLACALCDGLTRCAQVRGIEAALEGEPASRPDLAALLRRVQVCDQGLQRQWSCYCVVQLGQVFNWGTEGCCEHM